MDWTGLRDRPAASPPYLGSMCVRSSKSSYLLHSVLCMRIVADQAHRSPRPEIGDGVKGRARELDNFNSCSHAWGRDRWEFMNCGFLFILKLKFTSSFFDGIEARLLSCES